MPLHLHLLLLLLPPPLWTDCSSSSSLPLHQFQCLSLLSLFYRSNLLFCPVSMAHSFQSPEATGAADNPNNNSFSSSPSPPTTHIALVAGRAKTSRKKSRVTRSQINDFHAIANTCNINEEDEEERTRINPRERNTNKIRNRYHVCRHCKRSFNSGRALGGHIRIHGASFKGGGGAGAGERRAEDSCNNSSSKSLYMLRAAEVDGSEESDSDSSGSSEGGLSSPKMVSLYTLRNNPKRSSILMDPEFSLDLLGPAKRSSSCWHEGILPPMPYTSESAGSEFSLRRLLLPNWSVTRTRTTCSRAPGSRRRKDVGADDRDTAHLLVMLAGRNNHNNEERESTEESVYGSKPRLVSNLESQGSIEDLGGSGGEESRIVQKRRWKRKKTNNKEEGEGGNLVLESDGDGDVGGSDKHIKQHHQCNTCKKVFNSHQALGGHRASHRKVKGCFAADGDGEGEGSFMLEAEAEPQPGLATANVDNHIINFEEEGAVTMSHLTQEESPEQESFPHKVGKAQIQTQTQTHQCSICRRVFSSGQALGGHKRCHWIGDRITETATSVISTEKRHQLESVNGRVSRSLREEMLDLNQPPPMDDDDIRAPLGFDVVPACAESVNQRVKMLGGAVANNAVDSFKAAK